MFAGGIEEVNFKKLASIYKEAMARITPTFVLVLAAEDETGIIGQIVYNQASDELLGFGGVKGPEQKCLDYFTVVVGNEEECLRPMQGRHIWESYFAESTPSTPSSNCCSHNANLQ